MKKRVLLVDDDPDQVTAATVALELAGYDVLSASSGAEGLARARAERPDAIVLDVMMETMGAGFTLARTLRADADFDAVPLIMLTGVNREGPGIRFGADEDWNPVDTFLDKPVTADRLVEEVDRALAAA